MTSNGYLPNAPEGFAWPRCAEAATWVSDRIETFLVDHALARRLAADMANRTSTRFVDWVDHVVTPDREAPAADFGYVREPGATAAEGAEVRYQPHAQLPRVIVDPRARATEVAIRVDSVEAFLTAHRLAGPIEGAPLSRYRRARVVDDDRVLWAVERRGTRSMIPDASTLAAAWIHAVEGWATRPRRFDDDFDGMARAAELACRLTADLGEDLAAAAFLEAERRYWQGRNRAGSVQKARQDALGLGWANHDHHTFRSSRRHFVALIHILHEFGFRRRERFYAGAEAGWGAQVMEQPGAGLVIFADVDLGPGEVEIDFSERPLPDLGPLGTIGLWCALHGESILQAGLHHLEAQFAFDDLRRSLKEFGVETMAPFTDFSFLRQAFTRGEIWEVDPGRLKQLRDAGALSEEAYVRIRRDGAVGSHLENLQRRDGFKGFNQAGVSNIIREVHPERQALRG